MSEKEPVVKPLGFLNRKGRPGNARRPSRQRGPGPTEIEILASLLTKDLKEKERKAK